MNKTTKRILQWLAVVIVIGAIAYPKLKELITANKATGKDGKPVAKAGSPPAAVKLLVLKAQPLTNDIQATGSLIANEAVEIHPEIMGVVEKLYIKEGQNVQKGDLLFTIRANDLVAQQQKLESTQNLASSFLARQKLLLEKDAISQQDYDNAANSQSTTKADLANLKALLAKATVKAPFSGTIGLRYISEGAYITPATKIATISNISPIKLDFSIPAKYAADIKIGQTVKFTVEADTTLHSAKIYAVEPQIDLATRTLQVRALSPNPNNKLLPGAFVTIKLALEKATNVILVPTEAIVPELAGNKVFVIRGGLPQSQPVILGLRGAANVEIVKGLSANDTIVSLGVQTVKPAKPINILSVAKQ